MLLVRAGKGNKARSVPLNASAREALAVYVAPRIGVGEEEQQEKEKASLKVLLKMVIAKWPKAGTPQALEPLWLSRKGGPLTSSAIGQMMAELVRTTGKLVPQETSVHSLLHTFAQSYLSLYPGDVVGLAMLLGHNSLNTTRLYSQPGVSQLAGSCGKALPQRLFRVTLASALGCTLVRCWHERANCAEAGSGMVHEWTSATQSHKSVHLKATNQCISKSHSVQPKAARSATQILKLHHLGKSPIRGPTCR